MNDKIRVYNLTELKYRRRDLRKRSTPEEKILWEQLRNNRLGVKFRRQYSIKGYVLDFYCPQKKLAIELLGGIHNKRRSREHDIYREKYLESFGIKILKFWNQEITDKIDFVLLRILKYI